MNGETPEHARRLLVRHPFMLLGVATCFLWFMVEKQYLAQGAWLPFAIIPMYLVRLAIVWIEVGVLGGVPRWIDSMTFPLLFLPYLLLDLGWRRALWSLGFGSQHS